MSDPFWKIISGDMQLTVHKWRHYLPLYDRYFSKYKQSDEPIVLLEIGIWKGGSVEMWNKYFGADKCQIYAIDIDPHTLKFEQSFPNLKVFIGDQADKSFLNEVTKQIPSPHIVIDYGGHTMVQQINTFEVLYPHLLPGGTYLCEDLHTSYLTGYGGGYKNPSSFIEFSKNLIDSLHTHWSPEIVSPYAQTISGLHYHDSMLFVDKPTLYRPPIDCMMIGKRDAN